FGSYTFQRFAASQQRAGDDCRSRRKNRRKSFPNASDLTCLTGSGLQPLDFNHEQTAIELALRNKKPLARFQLVYSGGFKHSKSFLNWVILSPNGVRRNSSLIRRQIMAVAAQ